MHYKELANIVMKEILLGANLNETCVVHSEAITTFQGYYATAQHTIKLNASSYLQSREGVVDEATFALMMPLFVSAEMMTMMNTRDWQAFLVRQQLLDGLYGERVQQQYSELHMSLQMVLAYAVLDKYEKGETMFTYIVKQLFPQATCYTRNVSTVQRKQLDWIIHVPTHEQNVAEQVVSLCAQLLLPITHVIRVVGQEPPALLDKQMRIGGVRLVDERFYQNIRNDVEVEQHVNTI